MAVVLGAVAFWISFPRPRGQARSRLGIFRAYHIGRLYGVDVNVHPTFALVFLWVVYQWGFGPHGGIVPFALGCLFVVLIVLSVLLHELGHCAMAQQYGIRVLDITLWPFNGVARIEQAPETPRAELMISLAGPFMNLALFVALMPALFLLGATLGMDVLVPGGVLYGEMTPASFLAYLALTNLFIFAFNLFPAFPLDGGHVLRAALSPSMGRERATRIAVRLGTFLALAMMAVGVVTRSVPIGVMGVFVLVAAQVEGRMVRVESAMRRLRVGSYALWDMGGISPERPLTFALRGGPRDIVVTENGYVLGMLWRADLLEALRGGHGDTLVGDLMDSAIYVADTDDSIYDVQRQMNESNRWAVPVTEDGLYRGIFTADRFVHLYRQIAPGIVPQWIGLPDDWKQAIADTFRPRAGK
ncbi:MAG: site-2 protease family protein [Thermomicrobiales bacterium]